MRLYILFSALDSHHTMSVLQTILNNICLQEESEDISRGLDLGKCDQDVHEKERNGVVDIYVASKLC